VRTTDTTGRAIAAAQYTIAEIDYAIVRSHQ
jgi:hypothetical protein